MSFFYDKETDYDTPVTQPDVPYYGPEVGFFQGVEAAYQRQTRGENTDAYSEILKERLDPVIEAINERSGKSFINPGNYGGIPSSMGQNEFMTKYSLDKILSEIRANPDLYPEYKDLTAESIDQEIKDTARKEIEIGQNVSQRTTTMGEVGDFLGTVGGLLVDDNFFETNIATGGFSSFGKTLASKLFFNAAQGAGIETALQPAVKEWYESLGLEYSWDRVAANIAAGGVLGAALPTVPLALSQIKSGVVALKKSGAISEGDARVIDNAIEDAEVTADKPDGVSDLEHIDNVAKATSQAMDGRLPGLDESPRLQDGANTVPDPEALDPVAIGQQIDDIADDITVALDDEVSGGLRTKTGAELKRDFIQEDRMIERFRGCVIR